MPCLFILWSLVPDGWLVWDLWLTPKWKVKLGLKSSTPNEAGTVTDCAYITCFLQWPICNISSLHRWMLRPVPSSFCKLNRILYWCSFLKNWHKHRASLHRVWSRIYLHRCKSKAAFYNLVEVTPVWKWCDRKIGFLQCSTAVSPLKQLFWTNEQGRKSLLPPLLDISLRVWRAGKVLLLFAYCILPLNGSFFVFFWSALCSCWKCTGRQCFPTKVSCCLTLLGENILVSPDNHTLI